MTAAKGPRLLFFLSLFFRSGPTFGKEQTKFQIAHRWYNFHFSSPTAEARPPSAHPAPPPTEVKAGPGRGGQQRPRASPGGARQRSCGSSRIEDQPQLRAAPAPRSPWRGVGADSAAANLVRAPWGRRTAVHLGSAESGARERGKARTHGCCSDAAHRLDRAGCGARKTKNFRAGRTCGCGCQVPNPQTRAGGAAGGSGYRGWPGWSQCAAAAGMVERGRAVGRAGAAGSGGRAGECAGAGGAARSAPSRRCSPRISFRDPVI